MAKGKNAPKKDNFMDELKDAPDDGKTEGNNDDVDNDEQGGEEEESEQPVKSRKGLSSVPMSLKRIRKTVENLDLDNLLAADKFDLRMALNYIEFLKETIGTMIEKIK